MIRDRFFKLRRLNGNELHVPNWARVDFGERTSGCFHQSEVENVIEFAFEMSFGSGHHRQTRTGGSLERPQGQIFANTFQGKLSEIAVYRELETNDIDCEEVDFDVHGEGIWDEADLEVDDIRINIKSTKEIGQLLLLEAEDWDNEGRYLPNRETDEGGIYDYFILVRIQPSVKEILDNLNILNEDEIGGDDRNKLSNNILGEDWLYEISGWITRDDLQELIRNRFIIRRGELLNGSMPMDADNYYVKAYDMRLFPDLILALS